MVAPGPIHTRLQSRAAFDALGATTVLRHAADPNEIAQIIVFLASARARYLTGTVIDADGGRTATGHRWRQRIPPSNAIAGAPSAGTTVKGELRNQQALAI